MSSRVLLADDEPAIRRLLARLLQRLGLESEIVSDGEAAVAEAERRPYDAYILDEQMPRLSGAETAERIRALGGAAATAPIFSLSGAGSTGGRAGWGVVSERMTKPISLQQLREVLSRWLPMPGERPDVDERPSDPRLVMALDPDLLLSASEGRPELLARLARSFQRSMEHGLSELRLAIEAGDPERVVKVLHRLKGTASMTGAVRLVSALERLERDASPLAAAIAAGDELTKEVAAVNAGLTMLAGSHR